MSRSHVLRPGDKAQFIPMEPGTRELLDRQRAIRRRLLDLVLVGDDHEMNLKIMANVRQVDNPGRF